MRTLVKAADAAKWIVDQEPLPVVWRDDDPAVGFDARSAYVETYWLAVLGPSAIMTMRRLAGWLEGQPSGMAIELGDLAASIGLGHTTSRNSPVIRTLQRLVLFGVARIEWDAYALARVVPPLAPRQMYRLPPYLAERHDHDLRRMLAEAASGSRP